MDSTIRPLTAEEVDQLVVWAGHEGWNPGQGDAALFWNADPQGYLGVEVADQFVGGGAIIRHNSSYGFMGLFIVQPEFRGQGLGTKLWHQRRDHLCERLSADGTIGLDGVDAMVPFYAKGGFEPFTRHRRFMLRSYESPANNDITENNFTYCDLREVPLEQIEMLDQQCFPGPREAYLQPWIHQQGHHSLGIIKGGYLQSMGVMRPCQSGWKIGPLFAESPELAEALFQKLLSIAGPEEIYLDVPDNNPEALKLCQRHNMEEVFGCVRMYLGPPPELAHEKIFGITTLEIG